MSYLQQLKQAAGNKIINLTAIDNHLAEFVYEETSTLQEQQRILLSLTCLVLFQAQQQGHTALSNDALFNRIETLLNNITTPLTHLAISTSDHTNWLAQLENTAWLSTTQDWLTQQTTPLIYFTDKQLFCLQKNLVLEQTLAQYITNKMALQKTYTFTPLDKHLLDHDQINACRQAIHQGFSLVCGGPGSGKTSVVFNILISLYTQDPDIRIALATSTGKAATRLNQSLNVQISALSNTASNAELSSKTQQQVSHIQAQTLHRLLGYSGQNNRFLYHQQRQLALDVLIIDEASMLNFNLLSACFDALPTHCQLILLGDAQQLPAIEHSNLIQVLQNSILQNHIHVLTGQYRFSNDSAIAQLLSAIKQQQPFDQVLTQLLSPSDNSLSYLAFEHSQHALFWDKIKLTATRYLDICQDNKASITEKLAAFYHTQILCPFKDGEFGSVNINQQIDYFLSTNNAATTHLYPGKPIMIQKNNYQLGLFNGDIGVLLIDNNTAELTAYFPSASHTSGAQVRQFSLSQLPTFDSCYAMSIHKSQGSEFDHVVLVLPPPLSDQQSQLLQQELIYTGISRAKHSLFVYTNTETLRIAYQQKHRSQHLLPNLLSAYDNKQHANS